MDIRFKQVDFTYQPNTPFEQRALFDINLTIQDGSYTAIVGHTGSGKSTLLQHLNALVKPTKGQVTIGERRNSGARHRFRTEKLWCFRRRSEKIS